MLTSAANTKLKLPTPVKKPAAGASAVVNATVSGVSTATVAARKLKRRSIDISNQPAAKKKASVQSSGYGQSRPPGGSCRPLTTINSSATSGHGETFRRGVLSKTELRTTGRPTNIAGNAMSGRPPPVVARKRSSVSSRQSDASWKEEMAARIEALEVEKREKGVLMQTTVSEKDHLIARLEADVTRLESAKGRAEKELEALKDALC
uniref:Cytospin-A n=1 Tax=Plectus sambesii TaxID=2011161 RepID=A0A914V064_9BILA